MLLTWALEVIWGHSSVWESACLARRRSRVRGLLTPPYVLLVQWIEQWSSKPLIAVRLCGGIPISQRIPLKRWGGL